MSSSATINTRKSLEAMNAHQMPIVYKRQHLSSNTTCTHRHDKENYLHEIMSSCLQHFLSFTCMYVPSFSLIPFILSKIWPGQATFMKIWLREDNSVNIQGRIMVLEHCSYSHCHLTINQVSFHSLMRFSRYGPDKQPLWKMCLGR